MKIDYEFICLIGLGLSFILFPLFLGLKLTLEEKKEIELIIKYKYNFKE